MMTEEQVKDFSASLEPKRFRINDDIFECSPELPLGLLSDLSKLRNLQSEVETKGLEAIFSIFELLMFDESMAVFRSRMSDKKKPIGVRHVMEIIPWLLEEYGLRPTQPSSPSSTGSDGESTGTSLTAGARLEELTQLGSQLTDAST